MNKESNESLSLRGTTAVYARSSRRGFLARTAAAVIAFGLGERLLSGEKAEAAEREAPACCMGGPTCPSCPGLCPDTTACPPGYEWTGYRWACRFGVRSYYCRDCKNSAGDLCICGCRTPLNCSSPGARTATELSAAARRAA